MPRPLMQHGIGQLETMFATMTGDTKVLRQLELELSYRQVPRAYALADKVAMALRTGLPAHPVATPAADAPPAPAPIPVSDPFDDSSEPAIPVYLRAKTPQLPSASTPALAPRPAPSDEPPIAVSLDEAYRVLGVTAATAWDQVERARHQLVDQAHPTRVAKLTAEPRAAAQLGARKANAAYALVAGARSA